MTTIEQRLQQQIESAFREYMLAGRTAVMTALERGLAAASSSPAERTKPAVTRARDASSAAKRSGGIAGAAGVGATGQNERPMTLQRIAWLVTVAALLIGALVMLLSHYQGYAALFAAVAASAAINLR